MCMTILMNDRPVIIDQPGWYETRGGSFVHIDTIQVYHDEKPVTRFNCKGNRYAFNKHGKLKRKEWNIWHPSGAHVACEEHPNDIVRKCPSSNEMVS